LFYARKLTEGVARKRVGPQSQEQDFTDKDTTMLDEQLKTQLAAYLERVQQPFELVASLDDSETARDMRELLTTIQSLRSDKITLRTDGNDARKPSFSLQRAGSSHSLRFAGLPLGHE